MEHQKTHPSIAFLCDYSVDNLILIPILPRCFRYGTKVGKIPDLTTKVISILDQEVESRL